MLESVVGKIEKLEKLTLKSSKWSLKRFSWLELEMTERSSKWNWKDWSWKVRPELKKLNWNLIVMNEVGKSQWNWIVFNAVSSNKKLSNFNRFSNCNETFQLQPWAFRLRPDFSNLNLFNFASNFSRKNLLTYWFFQLHVSRLIVSVDSLVV